MQSTARVVPPEVVRDDDIPVDVPPESSARQGRLRVVLGVLTTLVVCVALVGVLAVGGVVAEDVDDEAPDQKWSVSTSYTPMTPDVEDGVAYVTAAGNNDGALYAFDEETGDKQWSVELPHEPRASATVDDGVVYVGTNDFHVYAYDAEDGEELWDFDTGSQVLSSPTVVDDTVYVTTRWNGDVFAIDANTGEEVWEFDTPSDFVWEGPHYHDGTVYVGSSDQNVYGIDADSGEETFRFTADGYVSTLSEVVDDGMIYVSAIDYDANREYYTHAVDIETGEETWTKEGMIFHDYDDGMLYGPSEYADTVLGVDAATGEEQWESVEIERPSVSAHGGTVYVGNRTSGTAPPFYALDGATGDVKWGSQTVDDRIVGPPQVVDGTLYYSLAFSSRLYALDAEAAWFSHDPREGVLGESVTFDATKSNLPNGDITEYRWDFTGDGSFDDTTSDPVTTWEYSDTGQFRVRLQVEGEDGRTAEMTDSISVTRTLWRTGLGDGVYSSPTIVDGSVFVGSDDGRIQALDADDGSESWHVETDDRVTASPAVSDGVAFVGSNDGHVYALDTADGSEEWTFETDGDIISSPAVADGVVYIGSEDNHTYALDVEDGSELWSFETGDSVRSSPLVADGIVYVGSDDTSIYALNATDGTEEWAFETGSSVFSSPTLVDDQVFVASDQVYALDAATGSEAWTYEPDFWVVNSLTVEGDSLYVKDAAWDATAGTYQELLTAVDIADGTEQWTYEIDDAGWYSDSTPTVADGIVYVGSNDGGFHAIDDSDGSHVWSTSIGDWVGSSPTVVDGTAYVGSHSRGLLALDTGDTAWSADTRVTQRTLGHHDGPPSAAFFAVDTITDTIEIDEPGDDATVSTTIQNTGQETTTQTVVVSLDGAVVEETDVTLESGATESLSVDFETADLEYGQSYDYTVETSDDTATGVLFVEEEPTEDDKSGDDDDKAGDDDEFVDEDGAGFGAAVALIALLVGSLVYRRSRPSAPCLFGN